MWYNHHFVIIIGSMRQEFRWSTTEMVCLSAPSCWGIQPGRLDGLGGDSRVEITGGIFTHIWHRDWMSWRLNSEELSTAATIRGLSMRSKHNMVASEWAGSSYLASYDLTWKVTWVIPLYFIIWTYKIQGKRTQSPCLNGKGGKKFADFTFTLHKQTKRAKIQMQALKLQSLSSELFLHLPCR